MEKTAVEYIAKELSKQIDNNLFMEVTFNKLLEQAKAIEKNQIVLAFINGDNSDCLEEENSLLCALAYYNEKFKK